MIFKTDGLGNMSRWIYNTCLFQATVTPMGYRTSTDGGAYTYDANGNQTVVAGIGSTASMTYDMADRLVVYAQGSALTSYTYDGDGLKRSENTASGLATLVWDGTDYLEARS